MAKALSTCERRRVSVLFEPLRYVRQVAVALHIANLSGNDTGELGGRSCEGRHSSIGERSPRLGPDADHVTVARIVSDGDADGLRGPVSMPLAVLTEREVHAAQDWMTVRWGERPGQLFVYPVVESRPDHDVGEDERLSPVITNQGPPD